MGDGNTITESEIQTINITRAAHKLTPTQPSAIGGSGSIPMTAVHEYRADSGGTCDFGQRDNNASARYISCPRQALGTVLAAQSSEHHADGVYRLCGNHAHSGAMDATPAMTGLVANGSYAVNGTNFTADVSKIGIINAWFGAAISLVKKGDESITTNDSTAQNLSLPARPAAPPAP